MSYKIINNTLDFRYWINLIDSPYFFKKIRFNDLFKEIKETKNDIEKEKIKNDAIVDTILTWKSIDEILDESIEKNKDMSVDDEINSLKLEIEEAIKKTKQQQEIKNNFTDENKITEDIINNIETTWNIEPENISYINKISSILKFDDNRQIKDTYETLIKYKNAENLTWYDVWLIARCINTLFASYFNSLFIEISNIIWNIDESDLDSDEWYVIKKILSNQSLEIYEMFRFVNWIQEYNHIDLIANLNNQENKNKYNFLKWFLDSESYWWIMKGSFYVVTLDQLRKFRNFYAHHNDERNIERIIKTSSPDKMKLKFYTKFLWNFDVNWKWFLQYIIERIESI